MKRTSSSVSSSRSKKCMPSIFGGGLVCLANMTWFIIVLLVVSVVYLYYTLVYKPSMNLVAGAATTESGISQWSGSSAIPVVAQTVGVPSLSDPYIPPLKSVDIRGQPSLAPVTVNYPTVVGQPRYGVPQGMIAQAIAVNIPTSTADMPYQQIGILTKTVQSNRIDGSEPTILPLMGRNLMNGRDKWQYYTVSNTNNSVRLPVSVKGKSCTNEYGCDGIYNGDSIYVEGYDDTFKATIYENSTLRYIPL